MVDPDMMSDGSIHIVHGNDIQDERLKAFVRKAIDMRYHPTWYLYGGLLQTISASWGDDDIVAYDREMLTLDEVVWEDKAPYRCTPSTIPNGKVALDWVKTDNTGPIVVISPGLTGDSSSSYVQRVAHYLAQHNFQPVVFNPRGRGGVQPITPFLYSAGFTHDYRRAVQHIRKNRSDRLFAVGYSLGGNYLAKFLGEEGSDCVVEAACCLAPPVDLTKSMENLETGFFQRLLIDPTLTRGLQDMREDVQDVFLDPGRPDVDVDVVKQARTVREFDHSVTAPCMGCKDAAEYYEEAACKHTLHNISVPTMFLHAANDPVIPAAHTPLDIFRLNPNTVSLTTGQGGHSMDWPTGSGKKPWAPSVVHTFFTSIMEDVKGEEQ